jgi:lipopolysaccharide assembly protein A
MQFLKTLLWVTLIIAMILFAINNWVPVSVKLWGGMLLDTKLPMLVIVSFIAGYLPLYLIYRATSWRLKRKILTLEGSGYRPPLNMSSDDIAPPVSSREGSTI